MAFHSRTHLLAALEALGQWLAEQPAGAVEDRLEFLICGGACFLFHDFPRNPGVTNDVDVWCRLEGTSIIPLTRWPEILEQGIEAVRRNSSRPLPPDWLNFEASRIARHFGLPSGALRRATVADFGPCLRARFCSRHDLVAFKFLALIAARHQVTRDKSRGDLLALTPTAREIQDARKWLMRVPGANQAWKDDCAAEFGRWEHPD